MEFLKNSHPKKGFTMMQLIIGIVAVSIIAAASVPIISKKFQGTPDSAEHGAYLCYYHTDKNGKTFLHERRYTGKSKLKLMPGYPKKVTGDTCNFVPPEKATYFTITAIGGGGGGGDAGWKPSKYLDFSNDSLGRSIQVNPTNKGEVGTYVCDELEKTDARIRGIAKSYSSNASKYTTYKTCSVNKTQVCYVNEPCPSVRCADSEGEKTVTDDSCNNQTSFTTDNYKMCPPGACKTECQKRKTEYNEYCKEYNYIEQRTQVRGDCIKWGTNTGGAASILLASNPQCLNFDFRNSYPQLCQEEEEPEPSSSGTPISNPIDPIQTCDNECSDPPAEDIVDTPSSSSSSNGGSECIKWEMIDKVEKIENGCKTKGSVPVKTSCTQEKTYCESYPGAHKEELTSSITYNGFSEKSNCCKESCCSGSCDTDSENACMEECGKDSSDKCKPYKKCTVHEDDDINIPDCPVEKSRAESCTTNEMSDYSPGGNAASCATQPFTINSEIELTKGSEGFYVGNYNYDSEGNGMASCKNGACYSCSSAGCGGATTVTVTLKHVKDGHVEDQVSATANSASKGGGYRKITVNDPFTGCAPVDSCGTEACSGGQDIEDVKPGTNGTCSSGSTPLNDIISTSHNQISQGEADWLYYNAKGAGPVLGGKIQVNYVKNSNKLSRGKGGFAGEVKTVIVRSLNNKNIKIHVGAGGKGGREDINNGIGGDGDMTYIGDKHKPIVIAKGGKGGEANLPENAAATLNPYYSGYDRNNPKDGEIRKLEGEAGGTIGDIVIAKGFIQSSLKGDKFISELKSNFGNGGRGGGILHKCWLGMKITLVDKYIALTCNSWFPPELSADEIKNKLKTKYGYESSSEITDENIGPKRVPSSCTDNYDSIAAEDGGSGLLMIRW